jgi:predicted GH43/DUF377 family glycosyl hydrolase
MERRTVGLLMGTVACVSVITVLVACPPEEMPAAPERTSAELGPEYQLKFERVERLQTEDGGNLARNNVLSDPTVLFEDGKYRMWFTAATQAYTDKQEMGVAYAESDDGLVWRTRLDAGTGEPELLLRPSAEGWDAGGVETPSVVKGPDGRYRLYYSGDVPPRGSHSWAVGMAMSDDGFSWTKVSDSPVFDGQSDWEGPFFEGSGSKRKRIGGVSEPTVIYDAAAGLYKMWYSALGNKDGKTAFRIGYATSPDGVAWERQSTAVFEPQDGAWDDAVVSHTNVSPDPRGGYHLFYFGTSAANYKAAEQRSAAMIPGSIGHAYSPDGITWQRDANPVLSIVPDTWEAWMVGGPASLIQPDGQVKLWYFGSADYKKYSFYIGFATARLPISPAEN